MLRTVVHPLYKRSQVPAHLLTRSAIQCAESPDPLQTRAARVASQHLCRSSAPDYSRMTRRRRRRWPCIHAYTYMFISSRFSLMPAAGRRSSYDTRMQVQLTSQQHVTCLCCAPLTLLLLQAPVQEQEFFCERDCEARRESVVSGSATFLFWLTYL